MFNFASVTESINGLQGAIGAVGFLTAVVFGALYGRNKDELERKDRTIKSYSDANSGLEELLRTRNLQHEENQKRIIALEQKANILENQVTQAPSITKLAVQMGNQHKEMMTQLGSLTKELGNIAKNIVKG